MRRFLMKSMAIALLLECFSLAASADDYSACIQQCLSHGQTGAECAATCSSFEKSPAGAEPAPSGEPKAGQPPGSGGRKRAAAAATIEPGFYILFDYGLVNLSGSPISSLGDGYQLGAGYRFNQYFGLEGAYASARDSTDGNQCFFGCYNATLNVSATKLAMVGTLPLGDGNALYARFGRASLSADFSSSSTSCFLGCSQPITGSGGAAAYALLYGVGLEYGERALKLRVQYENLGQVRFLARYSNNTSTQYSIGVEMYSVGLAYYF